MAESCNFWVVGHDDERQGTRLVNLLEQGHDLVASPGIERPGWLIGEQEAWLPRDGTRDCNPLPLSTGELSRTVLESMTQSDAIDELGGPCLALVASDTHVVERQSDVFENRVIGDEMKRLENEPDVVKPDPGSLTRRERGYVAASEPI